MISSKLVSWKSIRVMYWPSRVMVTRSTMCWSSSSRWEMYTIPQPFSFRSRMMRNRSSISRAVRAEVGSSMMSTRALVDNALAISTICCLDTGSSPTTCRGSRSIFRPSRIRRASSSISLLARAIPRRSLPAGP